MAPKFGTSGLRGLVRDLTPDLVADHVRAFVTGCPVGTELWVGRDLRPSSPALAAAVLGAARDLGLATVDCGAVPTPALALAAMGAGASAVMVTGSHIPADRNGLKFYLPGGEITKADEAAILGALGAAPIRSPAHNPPRTPGPPTRICRTAGPDWVARYVRAFGPDALAGLRIGVWSHSAVSRDLLLGAMADLGAEVRELGRSEQFIPVDTEAVAPEARAALRAWAQDHGLDAVVSTDGDGDRPLLADAGGRVIPGDVLGQITAALLGAHTVVTPVSSNTGAEAGGRFGRVIRTRIGSPHVIAGMAAADQAADQARGGRVVGYEANGGFLLGFAAQGPAGPVPPLATRDSLLPLVAVLSRARAAGGLAALVAAEPARFTAADRLEHVPPEAARALLAGFDSDPARLAAMLAALGESLATTDRTDGLRLGLVSGRVLHMRPSGNAPEFRLYVEAESPETAERLLRQGLSQLLQGLSLPSEQDD